MGEVDFFGFSYSRVGSLLAHILFCRNECPTGEETKCSVLQCKTSQCKTLRRTGNVVREIDRLQHRPRSSTCRSLKSSVETRIQSFMARLASHILSRLFRVLLDSGNGQAAEE